MDPESFAMSSVLVVAFCRGFGRLLGLFLHFVDRVGVLALRLAVDEFAGLVADKRPWTLDDIYGFPEQEIIIKHICVEGWDYIGQWSGPNLRQFLMRIGADLTARYVAFHGNDDYMECIDMASALHPQTILATKYAGEPITDPFGAPLRLRTAVKLGYKNPKWIRAIEVTNTYPGGFWEKQGFNWFAGI